MIAAVRIVTAGAVPVGHRLVDDRALGLDVTERTEPGLRNRQSETVFGCVTQGVTGVTLLLGCGSVQALARQNVAVALGRNTVHNRTRRPGGRCAIDGRPYIRVR